jgi:hypothetical protein
MKKLIYGSLFLALVGIGIVGCEKKIIQPTNHHELTSDRSNLKFDSNVTTDGVLLIFNSLADYENLWSPNDVIPSQSAEQINQFVNNLSSVNYSKFKTSQNFETIKNAGREEEFPSLIFELLNKDGAIQVGTHVFYFDFIAKKGYAIKKEDKANSYSDLIIGNVSNPKVQMYNWEDEMIVWANDPAAKLGCSENSASTSEDSKSKTDLIEWTFLINGNAFQNTLNASVQYKKFDSELKVKYRWTPGGWDFYSKVVLRQKTQDLSASIDGKIVWSLTWKTADIPVKLEWQRRYKLKCKSDTGYQALNDFGTGVATGQSWHGIRACTKYIMGANAYAKINGNWELMDFDTPNKNVNGTLYQVRINSGY